MTKEYLLILTQIPIPFKTMDKLRITLMATQYDAVVVALFDKDYTPKLDKELNLMRELYKKYDNTYFISAVGNVQDIFEDDTLFNEFAQSVKDSKEIPLDDYELDEPMLFNIIKNNYYYNKTKGAINHA